MLSAASIFSVLSLVSAISSVSGSRTVISGSAASANSVLLFVPFSMVSVTDSVSGIIWGVCSSDSSLTEKGTSSSYSF